MNPFAQHRAFEIGVPQALLAASESPGEALYEAIDRKDAGMVRRLLEIGVDPNATTETPADETWSVLHSACLNTPSEEMEAIVRLLVEHGAEVNARTDDDAAPLHFACSSAEPARVQFLVDKGAEVNSRTSRGETPLHFAARRSNVKVVEILLDSGADANAEDARGRTPLDIAGFVPAVELLLSRGATYSENGSRLEDAYHNNNTEMVKFLLERGHATTASDGWSLLHEAAYEENKEIVCLLVLHGADRCALDRHGRRPSEMTKNEEILELLRSVPKGAL